VFALDLMSAFEREHMIFGLLGQANLTQNNVLYFKILLNFFEIKVINTYNGKIEKQPKKYKLESS
jgi:hypothetical protein